MRLNRVADDGLGIIFDLDQVQRLGGNLPRLGSHNRNRIAHVTNFTPHAG